LTHLSPESNRRLGKGSLVSLDLRSLPDEVNLVRSDVLGLLEDLPKSEEEDSQDLHGVVLEEDLDVKFGSEGVVSVGEDDNKLDNQGDVGTVGLKVAVVGTLGLSVDALSNTSAVVVDKGDVHDHKSDKTATSDNADQPSKDLGRAIGNLEEGEEREKHGNTEAIYRDTRLIAVSQESRGTAFERKRVESTGSAVGVCVTGGEDGRENQEVDEMRETSNAKVGHGNDIGRGSSIASSTSTKIDVIEGRVIVGTADANRKSTNNEKDAESIVDSLKGILDGKGRALGLGRDH
jgi:hypothetical protein